MVPEHGRGPGRPPFGLNCPQARVAEAEVRCEQIRTVTVLTFEMLDGAMRAQDPGDLDPSSAYTSRPSGVYFA